MKFIVLRNYASADWDNNDLFKGLINLGIAKDLAGIKKIIEADAKQDASVKIVARDLDVDSPDCAEEISYINFNMTNNLKFFIKSMRSFKKNVIIEAATNYYEFGATYYEIDYSILRIE